MATQQAMIAETIRSMKLALRRTADGKLLCLIRSTAVTQSKHMLIQSTDSDSDTYAANHSNRGNKLKRSARFVHEGRLDTTGGRSYRKVSRQSSSSPCLGTNSWQSASSMLDISDISYMRIRFAMTTMATCWTTTIRMNRLTHHPSRTIPLRRQN